MEFYIPKGIEIPDTDALGKESEYVTELLEKQRRELVQEIQRNPEIPGDVLSDYFGKAYAVTRLDDSPAQRAAAIDDLMNFLEITDIPYDFNKRYVSTIAMKTEMADIGHYAAYKGVSVYRAEGYDGYYYIIQNRAGIKVVK